MSHLQKIIDLRLRISAAVGKEFVCDYNEDSFIFFFQAEDGIRDQPRSRGLGDVYKRQDYSGI